MKLRRNAFSKPLTTLEFIMQTPRNVLFCASPSRYPLGTGFISFPYLKEETFPLERHCMTYCSSESGLSSHWCRIYKPRSRKEIKFLVLVGLLDKARQDCTSNFLTQLRTSLGEGWMLGKLNPASRKWLQML